MHVLCPYTHTRLYMYVFIALCTDLYLYDIFDLYESHKCTGIKHLHCLQSLNGHLILFVLSLCSTVWLHTKPTELHFFKQKHNFYHNFFNRVPWWVIVLCRVKTVGLSCCGRRLGIEFGHPLIIPNMK